MTPEELKEKREAMNLSQPELARWLGVDRMTISRWERGIQKVPSFLHLALKQIHTELSSKPSLKLVDRR